MNRIVTRVSVRDCFLPGLTSQPWVWVTTIISAVNECLLMEGWGIKEEQN